MPEVREATADDVRAIGTAWAAAFEDDPLWEWMTNSPTRWEARATTWFAREASVTLRGHPRLLVDEQRRGAAIWSPPGHWKSTAREGLALALPSLRLFGRNSLRSLQMMSAIEKVHPREPHWYLALLGTDPAHQGQGVGSALITTITDMCDEQGVPAYLESSKESNLAYYARHGFVADQPLRPAGGPPLWPMWRDPKG